MKPITRRDVLAAGAVLVLPYSADAIAEEPHRPVFVPYTQASPFLGDLETFNAKMYESHLGAVWVYDHRDNLPTGYEELERLPQNIRDAVFDALPVETTVDLVLERIRRRADADPELTDEQRAVLASAPLTITPEWALGTIIDREARWPDGGFWQRAREAFTMDEWRRVFGQSDAIDMWCLGRGLGLGDCARAVGW